MDSLFHFIFPVIAALAAKVHVKHKISTILLVGLITIGLDLDHILGFGRDVFHNVFITILIPLLIILIAFSMKKRYNFKGFSVLLLIFLPSHLILDLFTEGGISLFYPLSTNYYAIMFNVSGSFIPGIGSNELIISSTGLGILIYFLMIILPCLFLDEIINKMERKHEGFNAAVKDLTKPKK